MKIALDVDGVLADVIIPWLDHSNKIRTKISKHEITDWDFWKKLDIDRYDFYDELSSCWRNWIDIPPTEVGLCDLTEKLSELAHVDIVTARERSTDQFVKDWLRHHGIKYDRYVSVISGPMKADLDYDVFIDDSPLNAAKIIGNKKRIFLYSQPWNSNMDEDQISRISSLSEAVACLS